jgi:hypothetical protein
MSKLINLSENVIRIQAIGSEGFGTAFLLNYNGRQYWITAKHVFAGKELKKAKIFLPDDKHIEFTINEVTLHEQFDIMYFTVGDDFPLKNLAGINHCIPSYDCYGNDVYCLGFPYNIKFDMNINKTKEIPCIKKGVVNSICEEANFSVDKMLIRGFSGGPVLMKYSNEYKVIGIINDTSLQHLYKEEKQIITVMEDSTIRSNDENALCTYIGHIINLIK